MSNSNSIADLLRIPSIEWPISVLFDVIRTPYCRRHRIEPDLKTPIGRQFAIGSRYEDAKVTYRSQNIQHDSIIITGTEIAPIRMSEIDSSIAIELDQNPMITALGGEHQVVTIQIVKVVIQIHRRRCASCVVGEEGID